MTFLRIGRRHPEVSKHVYAWLQEPFYERHRLPGGSIVGARVLLLTPSLLTRYVYGSCLEASQEPQVLVGDACGRWLNHGNGIADFLLRDGIWSEEAGHWGCDLEGHVSLPSVPSVFASWLPWYEQFPLPGPSHRTFRPGAGWSRTATVCQNKPVF